MAVKMMCNRISRCYYFIAGVMWISMQVKATVQTKLFQAE